MSLKVGKVYNNLGLGELDKYVHRDTGEVLLGSGIRFSNVSVDSSCVRLRFERFIVLGDNLDELINLVGVVYSMYFIRLLGTCMTTMNIVSNGNYPHSKVSLSEYLGLKQGAFYKFLNCMFEHRLLAYVPLDYGDGRIMPLFICNPCYGFRRVVLDKLVFDIFDGDNYFSLRKFSKEDYLVFGV